MLNVGQYFRKMMHGLIQISDSKLFLISFSGLSRLQGCMQKNPHLTQRSKVVLSGAVDEECWLWVALARRGPWPTGAAVAMRGSARRASMFGAGAARRGARCRIQPAQSRPPPRAARRNWWPGGCAAACSAPLVQRWRLRGRGGDSPRASRPIP